MSFRNFDDLMREQDPERVARIEARVAEAKLALELRNLRISRGVTQVALAQRLDLAQKNISALESRDDVKVSTLIRYVEALGGRLRIEADFDDADSVRLLRVNGPTAP